MVPVPGSELSLLEYNELMASALLLSYRDFLPQLIPQSKYCREKLKRFARWSKIKGIRATCRFKVLVFVQSIPDHLVTSCPASIVDFVTYELSLYVHKRLIGCSEPRGLWSHEIYPSQISSLHFQCVESDSRHFNSPPAKAKLQTDILLRAFFLD